MKYSILYADPPWAYRNKKTGCGMISGSASKYKTMELDEICSMPIKNIIEMDCVLFLWATTPMKREALQVMNAWGFEYKTTLYWKKIGTLGMGYWFRGQVEELLFGVRGKIKAFRLQEKNILQVKTLSHSEKPMEFRMLIERATSKMPIQTKLELFARCHADGWDVYGDQVAGSIELSI